MGISDKSSGSYTEMLEMISCTAPPSEPLMCSDAGVDGIIQPRIHSETLVNDGLENENEVCSLSQENDPAEVTSD